MPQRLSLEQIAQNMFNGASIEEKIRLKAPLNRDERWQYDQMPFVGNDKLRLALLERGPEFAPLALEIGAHFVDGGGSRLGRGIALFVNDPEVAQRYGFEKTEHGILLGTVIPALLTMTSPEPTEDDLRRHARAQANLAALPQVEKQLRESGKRWFSLGRGWHFRKDTEEVVVWLNPADQDRDQYGWYTLAELREWAEDKGPVKNVRQTNLRLSLL